MRNNETGWGVPQAESLSFFLLLCLHLTVCCIARLNCHRALIIRPACVRVCVCVCGRMAQWPSLKLACDIWFSQHASAAPGQSHSPVCVTARRVWPLSKGDEPLQIHSSNKHPSEYLSCDVRADRSPYRPAQRDRRLETDGHSSGLDAIQRYQLLKHFSKLSNNALSSQ